MSLLKRLTERLLLLITNAKGPPAPSLSKVTAPAAKPETPAKTARSAAEQKAAEIAEVKAILASVPPPWTQAIEAYRRKGGTDALAATRPIPASLRQRRR